jgi:filamentous hemagglutinin
MQTIESWIGGAAGRLGSTSTRALNSTVASELEAEGYAITGGGGRLPEEYIPGAGPGARGGTYVDITAVRDGVTLRVQTVDVNAGGGMTAREADAALRIMRAYPSDQLMIVPKR